MNITTVEQVGFLVTFQDGSQFSETDGTWDDVPRNKVAEKLSFVNLQTKESIFDLSNAQRYFFSNENLGAVGGSIKSGKIFGAVTNQNVTEIRVDFLTDKPEERIMTRQYNVSNFGFIDSIFVSGTMA